jgi:hypothetical protein
MRGARTALLKKILGNYSEKYPWRIALSKKVPNT